MPNPINTPRGWLSSLAVITGALILYLGAALAAGLLSGSPAIGSAAANAVLFAAGLLWRRWTRQAGDGLPGDSSSAARRPGFWPLVLTSLVLCWLVGQTAAVWLYGLLGSRNFDEYASAKAGTPVLLMLLVALVLAPLGEEMLMRGVVYPRLRFHTRPLAAAALSSAVFSLMHLNLVQIAATVPLGFLLAAVYEQTGRLTPGVLMHAAFNVVSMVVPPAFVSGFSSLTFVMLGGAVLVLLLIRLYTPLGGAGTAIMTSGAAGSGSGSLAGK
ncbi:CPBP family intramembrane glutamic endopeptidase [Arthrobacter sp. AD-310]